MPLYDFACDVCHGTKELLIPFSELHSTHLCEDCGSVLRHVWLKFPGMSFKGDGCTTARDRRLKSNAEEAAKINARIEEERYDMLSSKAERWVDGAKAYTPKDEDVAGVAAERYANG